MVSGEFFKNRRRTLVQAFPAFDHWWPGTVEVRNTRTPRFYADFVSSEAVQIGGIASAIGLIGTWTGAQHDDGKHVSMYILDFRSSRQ
jgi:hypothetical protein